MRLKLSKAEEARYDRQTKINGWGVEKQLRLKNSRVAIVGLGGLGSPISIYLAAAGVGNLVLIDNEKFELSNLNRQIIAATRDVGRYKSEVAAEKLRELNPEINIKFFKEKLTEVNINEVMGDSEVVLDALDNWETRFLINRFCVKKGIPLVHGGVTAWGGQIFTVIPKKGPCLECVYKEISEVEGGFPVVGATPGIIGTIEALEVIKLITDMGRPLYDRILVFDGLETSFEYIPIRRCVKCSVCGD